MDSKFGYTRNNSPPDPPDSGVFLKFSLPPPPALNRVFLQQSHIVFQVHIVARIQKCVQLVASDIGQALLEKLLENNGMKFKLHSYFGPILVIGDSIPPNRTIKYQKSKLSIDMKYMCARFMFLLILTIYY